MTDQELEEIYPGDLIGKLAWLSGCNRTKIYDPDGVSGWVVTDSELQKFAELIVTECAKKIERDYKYSKGSDTRWNTAFYIACNLPDILKNTQDQE